jgi:methylmalonyl-CoA mutase C-terminal domain/subunit
MGRKPLRVLIAKPGLDGHDRGAKVIAQALMNAGMEVIYSGLHQTVDQIVQSALQEDVKIIGLSILSGAHQSFTEKLMKELEKENLTDIMVLIGGNIPSKDIPKLKAMGVKEVFPTGSKFTEIVDYIKENVG